MLPDLSGDLLGLEDASARWSKNENTRKAIQDLKDQPKSAATRHASHVS